MPSGEETFGRSCSPKVEASCKSGRSCQPPSVARWRIGSSSGFAQRRSKVSPLEAMTCLRTSSLESLAIRAPFRERAVSIGFVMGVFYEKSHSVDIE